MAMLSPDTSGTPSEGASLAGLSQAWRTEEGVERRVVVKILDERLVNDQGGQRPDLGFAGGSKMRAAGARVASRLFGPRRVAGDGIRDGVEEGQRQSRHAEESEKPEPLHPAFITDDPGLVKPG